ncbi:hypothetical protein ABZ935_35405 [Streptomyces coeruleorubidus]|uniref:hypothetical protein n=1 Tax=Streptomyces coeruleorubidus TaxID=116188 RepID=UPI0033DF7BC0
MGADIEGVIETRSADGHWEMAVDLLDLQLGRDYEAWGCLFNFGGTGGVDRSLFADRGLPSDPSDPVRDTGGEDYQHSHTYATWAEVAVVDWDAPLADEPAYYWAGLWRPGDDGELVQHDIVWASATPGLDEAAADAFGEDVYSPPEWPQGGEVHLDGAVYRPVILTARMLAPPDQAPWSRVWNAMRDLADKHGDDNVRLVVWFG